MSHSISAAIECPSRYRFLCDKVAIFVETITHTPIYHRNIRQLITILLTTGHVMIIPHSKDIMFITFKSSLKSCSRTSSILNHPLEHQYIIPDMITTKWLTVWRLYCWSTELFVLHQGYCSIYCQWHNTITKTLINKNNTHAQKLKYVHAPGGILTADMN